MTKAELLDRLSKIIEGNYDPEVQHQDADDAVLRFINDPEVSLLYDQVPKYYA